MNSRPAAPPPEDPLQQALALHREGKRGLAMQRYVAILERDPTHADALYYVAVLALQEGQFAEGIKVIERALKVGPERGRLYNLLGQAHMRLNDDAEALRCFERAIACEPGFADAYGNRANLLADMGRPEEALAAFDQALLLRPDNAEDHCNRASVLADLGRADEALAGYDRAIALFPELAPAHFNRADVLMRLGRLEEALAAYDRTLALEPELAAAHSNRGIVLKELGRLDEARASADRALAIDLGFAEAYVNRGNVAFELGRLEDAQADYVRALERRPELPAARYARGLAFLAQGDWPSGFPLYDERENIAAAPYKPLPYPRWRGEPMPGERLVLLCEQGLGDTIQFCRFGPYLAARGLPVTLLASAPMRPLLSTLRGVNVATSPEELVSGGPPLRWLPLMSAPGVLGLRPDTVPAEVPYLAADPARIEGWRRHLGPQGFKIGINWAPGPTRGWFGRRRAIPLAMFASLAALPGVRLISLQTETGLDEIVQVPFRDRIERPAIDNEPGAGRFVDTAALMASLDLVVTCDTSIAHLAGALARPVFTALPHVPDWRWLRKREDCPWYPTMRLFRQRAPGDWREVFGRIAQAVSELSDRR